MSDASYIERRGQLRDYFDRTAVDAWKRFATDQPLSRIRATVRAGRERMRNSLLGALPPDLTGWRILDAGCGAGVMAVELAKRGAAVTGVDLSDEMIRFAQERLPEIEGPGSVYLFAGDMLSDEFGEFDAVVAMDSLIHYSAEDAALALARLARRTERKIVFTVAPRTPLLTVMHTAGKLFPRADRAPAIEPVSQRALGAHTAAQPGLCDWRLAAGERVATGFYISQAMEVTAL